MKSTLTASAFPNLLGPAAWNRILPNLPEPVPLKENITADITIVGAGFAGLSAAKRLLEIDNSLNIIVLDAARIAESSAGRNSGFMIDLPHELTSENYTATGDQKSQILLNRKAIAFAKQAVEEYQIDNNFFDPAGKINGAVSDSAINHNQNYSKNLSHLGEEHKILDQQEMREITGSEYYQSGLYTPGTVMLQPAGYIRGLAQGLKNNGVKIFENSPVIKISKSGDNWVVNSKSGAIESSKVILTVNGHLESFGIEQGRLIQLFLYAVMTPELDNETLKSLGGNSRWGITPSDPMGTTVRKIDPAQGGNRIITRTCATVFPNMLPNQKTLNRAARVMQLKFDHRFPKLAGLKMEYQWTGHLCLSLNSVSVVREIENGIFSGCVQNGLGTARGTLAGISVAEQALGKNSEITSHFKCEESPKKLPLTPLFKYGANAVIRYKEWRARFE